MSHQMCRECHRLVSESAKACPHCGISRPAASEGAFTHLRPYFSALLLGSVLAGVGGFWLRQQVQWLERVNAAPVVADPREQHPGFVSPAQQLWLGAPLFERATRVYVGQVISLDCPREVGLVSRRVTCLQIELRDGRQEWIERSAAGARYLVPRRE
jgi:hypothetical protein